MGKQLQAGDLDRKVQVLAFSETAPGVWDWTPQATSWARAESPGRTQIFAPHARSGRGLSLTMRQHPSRIRGGMLQLGGQYLYIAEIFPLPEHPGYAELRTAQVELTACRANLDREVPGPSFPAILTEEYTGHEQLEPLAVVTTDLMLVVPKEIYLAPGSWLEAGTEIYQVLEPHELDPVVNEYRLRRKEDC